MASRWWRSENGAPGLQMYAVINKPLSWAATICNVELRRYYLFLVNTDFENCSFQSKSPKSLWRKNSFAYLTHFVQFDW